MTLRSFDGMEPEIHEEAFVHPAAEVIGDVVLEADASVWPNVTLRGDHGRILLREGTNVQDGSVCHEGADIGPHATVGHCGIVHSATVEERALVGMNAVVLDGSTIGEHAMVAAGAVVTEDTEIPPYTLATGQPAEVKSEFEESPWAVAADNYVELSGQHAERSERLE